MSSDKKNALVTGANKGIGKAIAKRLAGFGYRVYVGSRSSDLGLAAVEEIRSAVANADVHYVQLDVTNDDSVNAAVAKVSGEVSKLHVLVNNAGALESMENSPPTTQSLDAIRKVFEVNTFGPIRVTQAFAPLIKAAGKDARVVMVSSTLGSITRCNDPAHFAYNWNVLGYQSSKSALNSITVSFSKEFSQVGGKVNTVCPGYCATDINNNTGTRTSEQGADIAVKMATLGDDGPTGQYFNDDGVIPW